MHSETADAVRTMTLKARSLLLQEISEQLEGIYGFLPDGTLRPVKEYPVLSEHREAAETRRRIDRFCAEQRRAGLNPLQAREKLLKEAAFTWLNRFVAFKMLETRRLIRQTIGKGEASNGFKMWLTQEGNEAHLADYERGDLPRDGLGEGPRQRAYRRFLLARCRELSREVRVLFDPDTLASRLFPRPKSLEHLVHLLNEAPLEEAWRPGHEETIGWVYQGFTEQEKKEVFYRLYRKKEKARPEDIPAATQIFTPRWIVRFLAENTLGRLWLDMHPDSRLADRLEYLVPVENPRKTNFKSVRDINLLDPACGTMHFGLVAFDLFVEMYKEEMLHAGEPGWPKRPPVPSEEEIPAAVVARNIHGIDIDLRAVQLSALTLYLKAKTLSPKVRITENRLAWANVGAMGSEALHEFVEAMRLGPIYRRILEALGKCLVDSEHLGSLLRLEEEIRRFVDKEREEFHRKGRQLVLPGFGPEQFETEAGRREFWEILEAQIGQALDEFSRRHAAMAGVQSFFAGESTKGLRLLDVMSERYDVVVTNPPYMTSRNMNPALKRLLQKDYPIAKSDLYAAFIHRCGEWLADGGRLGMIAQQSFLFISSYEKLRSRLRDTIAVETVSHVGPRAFEEVTGEKVNTVLFVFRREKDRSLRDESIGTYFRLVKEPDSEAKRLRFEQALANLRAGRQDPVIYRYRQGDFDAVPGSPWVYWITPGLRKVFETFPKLGDVAKPRQGLATADNFRFLRYWWEVGTSRIAFGCRNPHEAMESGKRWFPYMKGGSFRRWYGNQEYVVNWGEDGFELRNFERAVIRNPGFYFLPGLTWSRTTSKGISVRMLPRGYIIDCEAPSVFPKSYHALIAVLNSNNSSHFLELINPTIHFQVGDLARLPVPDASSDRLRDLVNEAVELAKEESREDETTWDFIAPPDWREGPRLVEERRHRLAAIEREIDEEVYRLYGIPEEDRRAIEAELGGSAEGQTRGAESAAAERPALSRDDLAKRWIGYAVGIVMGRFEPGVEGGLGCGRFDDDTASKLRAMADSDGVLVLDPGHSDDLPAKVRHALRVMLGDDAAREVVSAATGSRNEMEEALRRYLSGTFFRDHIKQYRKRPVYWLLQSPRKKYGVWVFHERLTRDTLYRIRGEEYVESKIRLLESRLAERKARKDGLEGRERRRMEKEIADTEELLDDVWEFARRIDAVIQRGYTPHIDDGVLITMAPLWELVPSWQAEPKKCWKKLEAGDYDWSHQAMDHWSDRVREKCRSNKSYAIAHGLDDADASAAGSAGDG